MKRSVPRVAVILLSVALPLAACGAGGGTSEPVGTVATSASESTATSEQTSSSAGLESRFLAEVWADNWFSLWVNGTQVGEDSVPITTERSFNADVIRFTADYPLTIAMVTKDYIEDESGLEYIGEPKQQIGDGGFIAQITDLETGRVVLTTSKEWRGMVIQTAPLNPECASSTDPAAECRHDRLDEPGNWQSESFDPAGWMAATEYTEEEVGTKDGYDDIDWDPGARLIWGSNLELQNWILWRAPRVSS